MSKIDQLIEELKKAKAELAKDMNASGAGTGSINEGSLAMSEAEPHKDDPKHEAKEKVKANKIKEEAQDLLDMHKAGSDKFETEVLKTHANGQWSLEKAKFEAGAHPDMKRKIRANRKDSSDYDKLNHKELSGALSSVKDNKKGDIHWRKPKSGEDSTKLNTKETAVHHSALGSDAVPKSGTAFSVSTGTSSNRPTKSLKNKSLKLVKSDEDLEKDNSVKPFGASVYNQTANLGRKATRTGETREGVGRNNAVRNYTTSGSKMSDTVEANNKKKFANAPVKQVTDPAKLKAIQDESNARMAAEADKKKK